MSALQTLHNVNKDVTTTSMEIRERSSDEHEENFEWFIQQNNGSTPVQEAPNPEIYQIEHLKRLENNPSIVHEHKWLFMAEINRSMERSKREAGIMREPEYAEFIIACTDWDNLSIETRKAIVYCVLKSYYVLKFWDHIELFWIKKVLLTHIKEH